MLLAYLDPDIHLLKSFNTPISIIWPNINNNLKKHIKVEERGTYKIDRERYRKAFIDVNVSDIRETTSEKVYKSIRATRSTNTDRIAAEVFEGQPTAANQRAGVPARLRIEVAEDLQDQLVR